MDGSMEPDEDGLWVRSDDAHTIIDRLTKALEVVLDDLQLKDPERVITYARDLLKELE